MEDDTTDDLAMDDVLSLIENSPRSARSTTVGPAPNPSDSILSQLRDALRVAFREYNQL